MLNQIKSFFIVSICSSCLCDVGVLHNINNIDNIGNTTAVDVVHVPRLESKTIAINTTTSTQFNTDRLERTLILLKPDALQRRLAGKIIERFENKGLKLIGMKMILATRQALEEHYDYHRNRSYFGRMVAYMTSGPIIPMVWEGMDAINETRKMIGNFSGRLIDKGTIRSDFGIEYYQNLVHGSDSTAAAEKEINIWFHENEIIS